MNRTPQATAPLVSVIIPAHNYGRYIACAIESLQAQTYANWECVVVDDGSTDDTRAVVGKYARNCARVKYFHQKNGGPSRARNTGIKESVGKYLQFLDADDMLTPDKLEQQVHFLESHPETDIVYCDMVYFGAEEASAWVPKASPSGGDVLRALVRGNIMGIHAALVRRTPPVFFDEQLRGPEDWFYWLCSALAGKRFEYVPGPQALTRAHGGSLSRKYIDMYASILRVRRKLASTLTDELLRELNRDLIRADEDNLMRAARNSRDFARMALISRQPKWLRFALTVPLARYPLVSHVRRFFGRT